MFSHGDANQHEIRNCKSCLLVARLAGHSHLHIVVTLDNETEGSIKGNVVLRAGLDVDLFHQTGIGHDLVAIDHIDERLLEGYVADARHVEPVDIVPPVDLVVLVLAVLDRRNVQGGAVGKHETVGSEPLVPGKRKNCVGAARTSNLITSSDAIKILNYFSNQCRGRSDE